MSSGLTTRNTPESLFIELFDSSLKHGKLLKKVVLNRAEQWKEEYFVLQKDRLWYLNMKAWENEKQWSYFELDAAANAVILPNFCFNLLFENKTGRSPVCFKCKSKEECEQWIFAINNRGDQRSDNDLMGDVENIIADNEYHESAGELGSMSTKYSFEGILTNKKLRKVLRVYLEQQDAQKARQLMFWERVEDFHSAFENRSETGEHNDTIEDWMKPPKQLEWAKQLVHSFIDENSQHCIEFDGDESFRDEVKDVVANYDSEGSEMLPPTLFDKGQLFCYSSLKYDLFPSLQSRKIRSLHKVIVALIFAISCDSSNTRSWASRLLSGSQETATPKKGVASSPGMASPASSANTSPMVKSSGVLGFGMLNFRRKNDNNSATSVTPSKTQEEPISNSNKIDNNQLLEAVWRRTTIAALGNHAHCWIPDIWWDNVDIRKWEEKYLGIVKQDHEVERDNSNQAASALISLYADMFQGRARRDAAMVTQVRREFRALAVKEDAVRLWEPNPELMDFEARFPAFVQPFDLSFGPVSPGLGSPGLVVLSGLMKCRHLRRANSSAQMLNRKQSLGDNTPPPSTPPGSSRVKSMPNPHSASQISSDSTGTAVSNAVDNFNQLDEFAESGVNIDFVKQYCILVEWKGRGRLLLLDPVTHFVNVIIEMNIITDIKVANRLLNVIKILDPYGVIWQLLPEAIDEEDARFATQRWLAYLSAYSSKPTSLIHSTRILQVGFLAKRGAVNKSFRKRWFVLSSDSTLRYFKDDVSGVFKGEINLRRVSEISQSAGEEVVSVWGIKSSANAVREKKELVLTTQGRLWVLLADSVEDCNRWFDILFRLIGDKSVVREDDTESGSEDEESDVDDLDQEDD